jgi:hypothetical protein
MEKVCAIVVPKDWDGLESALGSDKFFWLARKGRAVRGSGGQILKFEWFELREENGASTYQLDEADASRLLAEDVLVRVVDGAFYLENQGDVERLTEAARQFWAAKARKPGLSCQPTRSLCVPHVARMLEMTVTRAVT